MGDKSPLPKRRASPPTRVEGTYSGGVNPGEGRTHKPTPSGNASFTHPPICSEFPTVFGIRGEKLWGRKGNPPNPPLEGGPKYYAPRPLKIWGDSFPD